MSSEAKVYKKRPHRKVKSGCSTCKRRKIKCDEVRPQCSNCARYNAECVYPVLSSEGEASASTTPPVNSPEGFGDDFSAEFLGSGRAEDLPIRDLSLMHQWTIATCYGFGDEFPGDADPWRDEVPVLAQQFPFLMRGILAVSALHLARNATDRTMKLRYLRTAAYHQDLALPEYRSTLIDVTKDKAPAVLAFSAVLTVYSFAAPKDPGTLFAGGPPEWIFLHRGVGEIPTHWQSWIDNSFLHRQMHRRRLPPVDPLLNPDDHRLACLQVMLTELPLDQAGEAVVYNDALNWLRQAFAHICNPESRLGSKYAILFWIERVPQAYIDLLGLQRPAALVLLAHCCILLKRASHFWYFEGFAEHVLAEIKPFLDEHFLSWVEWPLQVCGMA